MDVRYCGSEELTIFMARDSSDANKHAQNKLPPACMNIVRSVKTVTTAPLDRESHEVDPDQGFLIAIKRPSVKIRNPDRHKETF